MAHLVLPDPKANTSQNQKSHFCQRHGGQRDNNSNTFYIEI